MTLWRMLMDYLKRLTLVDAAKQMLEDAGFLDHGSFLARRVKDGVLNLAHQFQQENYSTLVGRLVAALFARIARGSPPTPEFLASVWKEIEAVAKDEPYDEAEERGRWIQKRYPMVNWVGDLHKHISGAVFPRPRENTSAEKFAGAPLHREGPADMELVDDEPAPPVRRIFVSELRRLAKDGQLIKAIKLYREATGKGLKESKDFVYALRDGKSELVNDMPDFSKLDHYGCGLVFAPPTVDMPVLLGRFGAAAPIVPETEAIEEKLDSTMEQIEKTEEKMDAKTKTLDIIAEFCQNLESFTSLDISNKAKTEGVVARHREIAELVRAAFADGEMDTFGYVRDLIDVTIPGGLNAQTYLYHHTTIPVDDYRNRAQIAIRPQAQQPAPAQPALATPPLPPAAPVFAAPAPALRPRLTRTLNTASLTREQKGDGRLEVPHVWLASLGWQEGDTVSAVRDGNSLILKTTVQAGEQVVRTFTVDRWRRIRITTKALDAADIHRGTRGQHIMTLRTGDIKID